MSKFLSFQLLILLLALASSGAGAEQKFSSVEAYVANAYPGTSVGDTHNAPAKRTLWLSANVRQQLQQVLGHKVGLRIKYWQQGDRTVWVLDEVGKDQPITAGIVVDNNQLQDIQVLVYRESRGWEVKHDFFTDQFHQARLTPTLGLDRNIDGITGATLSVHAMQRMARAALLLHRQTDANTANTAQITAAGGK